MEMGEEKIRREKGEELKSEDKMRSEGVLF